MLRLLIVDDEQLEINALRKTVDFTELGFEIVGEALNLRQAKTFMQSQLVDLLLCDIEMPQGSGLELLAWVREQHPQTECVFLTCHADFSYARQAITLGSLDYILKPADPVELAEVVLKAAKKIRQASEQLTERQFSRLWLRHQPLIVERFWLDILTQKTLSTFDEIRRMARDIHLPGLEEMKVLPVLIKIQSWQHDLSARDETLMVFALKNIGEELILRESDSGIIIELERNLLVALLYLDSDLTPDFELILADCAAFIKAANQYINCDLCCYLSLPTYLNELVPALQKLRIKDKINVSSTNQTFGAQTEYNGDFADLKSVERAQSVIRKVRQFIDLNIDRDLSLEEIASQVYLNASYLTRLFKKETGQCISDYLIAERMKRAGDLLCNSEIAVSAVAKNLGYCNFSYFARLFKKYHGLSPLEYRKRSSQTRKSK